ncbi:MAG: 2-dehydropantoate 2-reductase [Gammaproteobacteria bacterium]|nr:2-dehydropantoate 2-reductase [Gammaproteobacteria bacterium]
MTESTLSEVMVMGAGSVGCYLGGCLAAAGARVTFVGRPRVLDALAKHGLTVSDLEGGESWIPPAALHLSLEVPVGARPDLVLLTVKSSATAQAATEVAAGVRPSTTVLSFQNGVSNAAVAGLAAPGLYLLPGMVPFNVSETGPAHFHRGTSGRLAAEEDAALLPWVPVFARAGIPLDLHADMPSVQWAKLLLNLNNPVNALSGLPLRAELMERDYRVCLAALMDEALAILQRAGILPAQLASVPARRLPGVLRLPTMLYRLVAARSLQMDAKARSSMADDLALGRRTEIDALCGEVVRLGLAHGTPAPLNAKMVELLEAWPAHPGPVPGRQLRALLGL